MRSRGTGRFAGRGGLGGVLAGLLLVAIGIPPEAPAAQEDFPTLRPATRGQAVATLADGRALPGECLTARIQDAASRGPASPADQRRALALLGHPVPLAGEERWMAPDGTIVRFTSSNGSFDRIPLGDNNGSGRPDVLDEALFGIADARRWLVEELGLPSPGPVEIVFAEIGGLVDGYLAPARGSRGRTLVVLAASGAGGSPDLRMAAAHQYAHAVALAYGPAVGAAWGESFATWAVSRLEGQPSSDLIALMSERLRRLEEGLLASDLALAAGNAVWLAFLEEAYGGAAVPMMMAELAAGARAPTGLDRAVRRVSGDSLETALREFHLWSVLVGDRDDGRHFSFGGRLASPNFASMTRGVPNFSVLGDPPVAPLGAVSLLVQPEETDGGVTLMFEGEVSGRWDVDVLVARGLASVHRVALDLSPEGRGQITLPLDGPSEMVVLVRNLADAGRPARFTWSVDHEPDFPFELGMFEATGGHETPGVLVTWETLGERSLVGFNVLRGHEGADESVRISPVWVPAVGDATTPISYVFIDLSAEPDVAYRYRIEGITVEGLTSTSRAVDVTAVAE